MTIIIILINNLLLSQITPGAGLYFNNCRIMVIAILCKRIRFLSIDGSIPSNYKNSYIYDYLI